MIPAPLWLVSLALKIEIEVHFALVHLHKNTLAVNRVSRPTTFAERFLNILQLLSRKITWNNLPADHRNCLELDLTIEIQKT
jgi:hypothetical protein